MKRHLRAPRHGRPLLRILFASFLALGATAVGCATATDVDVESGSDGDGGDGGEDTSGPGHSGGPSTSASGSGSGAGGGGGGANCDASEKCDGVDNTCDGNVDEGCTCKTGDTQPCYSGSPSSTEGIGSCKSGLQACDANGKWGSCLGEIVPAAEACNLIDDDCNGTVDDNLGTKSCGIGACQMTVAACENGAEPACVSGPPSVEVCDGIDNDCDQLVDEADPNLNKACQTGQLGVCSSGTNQCLVGVLTCVPSASPSPEVCDGADNDCDGAVDDVPGAGNACSTGIEGPCSAGTSACLNGVLDCVSNIGPSPETCDNVDNDCNGTVDDGNPGGGAACSTNLPGVCGAGTTTCSGGAMMCVQSAQASAEKCGDALDNDCNGVVDNGCAQACAHNKCSTGTALQSGCDPCVTQVCAADSYCCTSSWDSICVGEVSSICGISCMNCAHSKCSTGVALQSGCDPCVTQICAVDSFCCSNSWDSICVGEVSSVCGQSCP